MLIGLLIAYLIVGFIVTVTLSPGIGFSIVMNNLHSSSLRFYTELFFTFIFVFLFWPFAIAIGEVSP